MKPYKRGRFYNMPIRLSKKQRKNPAAVLREFYTWYHLDDIRQILGEWLEVAITTESEQFDTARDRSNLLFFARNIELLAEASYLLVRSGMPRSMQSPVTEEKYFSQ